MVSPNYDGNPNRYKINAEDDRRLAEPHRDVYFGIASALDAIEEDIYVRERFLAVDPGTRKAIRQAEKALRRAAWTLVVHAPEQEGTR